MVTNYPSIKKLITNSPHHGTESTNSKEAQIITTSKDMEYQSQRSKLRNQSISKIKESIIKIQESATVLRPRTVARLSTNTISPFSIYIFVLDCLPNTFFSLFKKKKTKWTTLHLNHRLESDPLDNHKCHCWSIVSKLRNDLSTSNISHPPKPNHVQFMVTPWVPTETTCIQKISQAHSLTYQNKHTNYIYL